MSLHAKYDLRWENLKTEKEELKIILLAAPNNFKVKRHLVVFLSRPEREVKKWK